MKHFRGQLLWVVFYHKNDVLVVFDQAVYANAQEILWKRKTALSNVVVCLGEFYGREMQL